MEKNVSKNEIKCVSYCKTMGTLIGLFMWDSQFSAIS